MKEFKDNCELLVLNASISRLINGRIKNIRRKDNGKTKKMNFWMILFILFTLGVISPFPYNINSYYKENRHRD